MTTTVKVRFGQLVIGPPGSGKTTYCDGMAQFLRKLGRPVAIVNLDPANDVLPYKADIDISDLVRVEEVIGQRVLVYVQHMRFSYEHSQFAGHG